MAVIGWPTGINLKNVDWHQQLSQPQGRSEMTGATRIVELGPAARWMFKGELPPLPPAKLIAWRGFAAALRGHVNTFRLLATEGAQQPGTAAATVNGAAQTGYTLNLAGMAASRTVLSAGQLMTVRVGTGGDEQLIMLAADLVSNAGGLGTATFSTPMRQSPVNGSIVELANPWALMRAIDPMRWAGGPAAFYTMTLEAEEAF